MELTELFHRYLNNQCTAEEVKTLIKYFDAESDNAVLKSLILGQLANKAPANFETQPEVIRVFEQTDQYFKDTLFTEKPAISLWQKNFRRYSVAASITVALLAFGAYFFSQYEKPAGNEATKLQSPMEDVQPGTDKAILTLTDGTSVTLDENHSETILRDAGISIEKTADGMLVYKAVDAAWGIDEVKYNQLKTPVGAQYAVLLADGSKVWLNAGSSLRYPLAFTGDERRVELVGEAYFEVEKSAKNGKHIPFFVETPTQVVQVLGTSFNISAYEDDHAVKTTLISGKVNVSGRGGAGRRVLSPGEQSIFTAGNDIQVIRTNVEAARAWKNGNFLYEDVYLKDILKQLSRWYDVEIDYANVPQTRYNMFISRKESLQSVLNMLRKTGDIKFKLTNNIIKVIR